MKDLEERLRAMPGTMHYGKRLVYLEDALSIVREYLEQQPRIYRGEELRDAPKGSYAFRLAGDKSHWLSLCDTTYRDTVGMEFFGPLPSHLRHHQDSEVSNDPD